MERTDEPLIGRGPFRTPAAQRPRCEIPFCPACAAAVDLMIAGHLSGETAHYAHELTHYVQRESAEYTQARERGRSIWLRGMFFVLLLALVLSTFAVLLRTAHAQAPLTRDEEHLALAVAKVAVNEASLARIAPADVALIWQATEGHGTSARERLVWLTAHSSCVLGGRDVDALARPGNCRWTRHLGADGGEPEGWPELLAWSRFAPRWRAVRALARRLVAGEVEMRPCPRTPLTWGGPMDHERALARGLVPLGCVGTRNEGYAWSSTSSTDARGDSAQSQGDWPADDDGARADRVDQAVRVRANELLGTTRRTSTRTTRRSSTDSSIDSAEGSATRRAVAAAPVAAQAHGRSVERGQRELEPREGQRERGDETSADREPLQRVKQRLEGPGRVLFGGHGRGIFDGDRKPQGRLT